MREVPPRASALLRGFESRNRDWEPKKRIFVYNAEALEEPLLARLSVMRLSEKARLPLAELRQA